MLPEHRKQIITERLQESFSPTALEVIDDSARHHGHAGAASGAGHYIVKITAECFHGRNRVDIHREIYDVLLDLMPDEIHALSIKLES